jgi:hypothetical protein
MLPTADCPERVRELFAPSNIPTKPDDFYRRVEVCLKNGKLATEHVPANGRERRVFVTFPEPYRAWAVQNGFPPPPTEKCDDIYQGVKRAEVVGPSPTQPVRGTVQIVGTALMDDLHHYDLEAGEGPNPTTWIPITPGRQQGVDNALLGVWDTSTARPGVYTLRLTLSDSLGNTHEGRSQIVVAAVETPTPVPSPAPITPRPNLTPQATPGAPRPPIVNTPLPNGQPTARPTSPARTPTPTRR